MDGEWACELVRCIEITSPNHCRSKWLSFDPYMRLLMVQTDLALDFAHLSVVEDAMQGTLPPPPKIHPSPPYTSPPPAPQPPQNTFFPAPPSTPSPVYLQPTVATKRKRMSSKMVKAAGALRKRLLLHCSAMNEG